MTIQSHGARVRWALPASALVVAGTAATFVVVRPEDPPVVAAAPSSAVPAGAGPASDTEGLGAMRAELSSLRAEVASLRSAASPSTEDAAVAAAADEPDEQVEARSQERLDRRLELLDAAMRTTAIDPSWSAQSEASLRNRFAEQAWTGASLDEASCRSRLCRVRVRFATMGARDTRLGSLAMLAPWAAHGVLHADADDPFQAVVYLFRSIDDVPVVE